MTTRRGRTFAHVATTIVAVVVAGGEERAAACAGGLISIAAGEVAADAQRIFISVRGNGTTDIVTEIGVPRAAKAYGVLVPLPGRPTLDPDPVPADELTKLAQATAPTILRDSGDDGGCGCPVVAGSTKGGSDVAPSVMIGAPVNIGPVTAVVLDAADPDAVGAWLTANAFVVPVDSATLISAYSGPGRTFVAIRPAATGTAPAAATDEPSSIGVHMQLPGDVRDMPLGFARLGAAPRVAFTVFVVAPTASGPSSPFDAITIDDLAASDLRASGYPEAVFRAIDARQGRAFVAEFSGATTSLPYGFGSRLSALIDPGMQVTRLSGAFSAAALTADVSFQPALAGPIPRTRTVSLRPLRRNGSALAAAGVGRNIGVPLCLAFCALAVGRRRRRQQHPPR